MSCSGALAIAAPADRKHSTFLSIRPLNASAQTQCHLTLSRWDEASHDETPRQQDGTRKLKWAQASRWSSTKWGGSGLNFDRIIQLQIDSTRRRTPELTGRGEPPIEPSLAHESRAIRAPVEWVVRPPFEFIIQPTDVLFPVSLFNTRCWCDSHRYKFKVQTSVWRLLLFVSCVFRLAKTVHRK
jgi:hypothetical protein